MSKRKFFPDVDSYKGMGSGRQGSGKAPVDPASANAHGNVTFKTQGDVPRTHQGGMPTMGASDPGHPSFRRPPPCGAGNSGNSDRAMARQAKAPNKPPSSPPNKFG